jgi:leucyl-tRNA synthetase
LAGWPERVKLMQENWIGKAGRAFAFHTITDAAADQLIGDMDVCRYRADTIMGVTARCGA